MVVEVNWEWRWGSEYDQNTLYEILKESTEMFLNSHYALSKFMILYWAIFTAILGQHAAHRLQDGHTQMVQNM